MLLVLLFGCGVFDRPMAASCSTSEQCEAPGVCLKGVCSGYGCQKDEDCGEGLVCGDFGGARVCATPCADDRACHGEQRCESIEGGDGGIADLCI